MFTKGFVEATAALPLPSTYKEASAQGGEEKSPAWRHHDAIVEHVHDNKKLSPSAKKHLEKLMAHSKKTGMTFRLEHSDGRWAEFHPQSGD